MSFARISAALKRGKLPHALLFAGPDGAGQTKAVRQLAQALFCVKKPGSGCDECTACLQALAGTHPDLRTFGPEEGKRNISIEEARRLISEANLKPFQAPMKLFVVEPAEYLNETSQNALLKTLEEPPARTYIVLICRAPEKLLETVRSRVQTVHFAEAGAPAAESDEKTAKLENALWERLASRVPRAPELAALTREQALNAVEKTIQGVRESLLYRAGCDELVSEETRLRTQRLAESLDEHALIRRIETLAGFKQKISENVNTKLAISVLWDEL